MLKMLKKLVVEGKTAQEIREALCISQSTLKSRLYDLMLEEDCVIKVAGLQKTNIKGKITRRKLGLIIPNSICDSVGIRKGPEWTVQKNGNSYILKEK